jgi:predicted CoA-binding protein
VSFLVTDDEGLRRILGQVRSIAMIGASDDPARPSYGVFRYLARVGYHVIPVTPAFATVQGVKAYPRLADVPEPIDMVDVFRRSDQVAPHVDEAIAAGAKVLWLQIGVIDEIAAEKAHRAGLQVVMDRCPLIEHKRLV